MEQVLRGYWLVILSVAVFVSGVLGAEIVTWIADALMGEPHKWRYP